MSDGERGAVGGLEVLPFGMLVFVAGALLIANAWAVVDAKLASEAAAREAGRAYVEAEPHHASRAARGAAQETMAGLGRDPARMELRDNDPAWVRCAVVVHEVSYRVPALTLPFVGSFGDGVTVRGTNRELIDPFAAGLGPEHDCGP